MWVITQRDAVNWAVFSAEFQYFQTYYPSAICHAAKFCTNTHHFVHRYVKSEICWWSITLQISRSAKMNDSDITNQTNEIPCFAMTTTIPTVTIVIWRHQDGGVMPQGMG